MATELVFGYVVNTISTAVNLVAGLFGRDSRPDEGEQFDHWGWTGYT